MGTAADFPVKWMHDAMPRAPQLYKQTGSVIALLDALLVTGWGAMTPQRIHVEGGVATVQCNAGDTFLEHVVIEVSGAEQPALNGQHRVLTSAATSFTFATEAADGYATGTISIKAAPAGWEKVFAGENKAVYRSAAPNAPGTFYQIDDSVFGTTMLRGYADMSDVDTGDYPFHAQGTTIYLKIYYDTGSAALPYTVVADPYAVIFSACGFFQGLHNEPTRGASPMFFGALRPVAETSLTMAHEAVCGYVSWWMNHGGVCQQGSGAYVATDTNGECLEANIPITFNSGTPYLSLPLQKIALFLRSLAYTNETIRGLVPGVYTCAHGYSLGALPEHSIIKMDVGGGQRFFVTGLFGYFAAPDIVSGYFAVDITGPWR